MAPRLRADAARNRERLIAEAQRFFTGGNASVALEDIARAAGVGVGTLYRHFPTREALVEAVYRSELDALAADSQALLAAHGALDALRLWMDKYARFVATKHAMRDALRIALTAPATPVTETRARVGAAVARFVAAGAADGTIRADIEPDDVTLSLAGTVLITVGSTDPAQLSRMLDLLVDGMRRR